MKLSKKYSLSNISKFINDPSLKVDFKIISDQVTNKTICVNLYRQNIYKWSQLFPSQIFIICSIYYSDCITYYKPTSSEYSITCRGHLDGILSLLHYNVKDRSC